MAGLPCSLNGTHHSGNDVEQAAPPATVDLGTVEVRLTLGRGCAHRSHRHLDSTLTFSGIRAVSPVTFGYIHWYQVRSEDEHAWRSNILPRFFETIATPGRAARELGGDRSWPGWSRSEI